MFRKYLFKFFYFAVFLTPFVLFLLPADFFDHGNTSCLSVRLAGIECYACGLTRGVMYFFHFEFAKSWAFNKLTFIVVPLLSLLWIQSIYEIQNKELPQFLKKIM